MKCSKSAGSTGRSEETRHVLHYLPDAFLLKISVERAVQVKDHYEFAMTICGRSRFCHFLADPTAFVTYERTIRYSSLLELHAVLKNEFAPILKAKQEKQALPQFPKKGWLGSAKKRAERRVAQLNAYFLELLGNFGSLATFSPSLLSFFAPRPIDLTLLGCDSERRLAFLKALLVLQQQPPLSRRTNTISTSDMELKGSIATGSQAPKDPLGIPKPPEEEKKEISNCDWRSLVPFDHWHRGQLFRVDIQNAYENADEPEVPICFDGNPAFLILLEEGNRVAVERAQALVARLTDLGLQEHQPTLVQRAAVAGLFKGECERKPEGKDERTRSVSQQSSPSLAASFMSCPYTRCSLLPAENVLESLDPIFDAFL